MWVICRIAKFVSMEGVALCRVERGGLLLTMHFELVVYFCREVERAEVLLTGRLSGEEVGGYEVAMEELRCEWSVCVLIVYFLFCGKDGMAWELGTVRWVYCLLKFRTGDAM